MWSFELFRSLGLSHQQQNCILDKDGLVKDFPQNTIDHLLPTVTAMELAISQQVFYIFYGVRSSGKKNTAHIKQTFWLAEFRACISCASSGLRHSDQEFVP